MKLDKKRVELANQLQKEVNEYWLGVTLDDIIRIKTKASKGPYVQREAEEFTAIRLPKREIPGLERTMRIIRLDEDRVTIRHLSLDRIESVNGKELENKTEWKVKGSKGYYTVKLHGTRYMCDCQGYKFRKKCKHSNLIKETNEQVK